MLLTFYGHASFAVDTGNGVLLFDPYITPNEAAKSIDIASIRADYMLLSHGHSDHVADAAAIAVQNDATVIAAFEVAAWMEKGAVSKTHGMNTGGKWDFDFGRVRCVNAIHSSSMPDGSYGGNPMGFVLNAGGKNFYYSGDTALTLDMQLIPRWGKLDFAILCIGDNFTMGYEDAIEAARMVQCSNVVGVHYDTFGYIKIDHERVKKAFADAGITLHLPAIGETIDL